jgi:leucine-zipper-like transcriptional regulator 1
VETEGPPPEARANHCSAVLGRKLFIFGGWNGQQRLNDVHVLDSDTMTWTQLAPRGVAPPPRAGMTLTRIGDRLYLYGGSGHGAKCFDDLQILDLKEMCWCVVLCCAVPVLCWGEKGTG